MWVEVSEQYFLTTQKLREASCKNANKQLIEEDIPGKKLKADTDVATAHLQR